MPHALTWTERGLTPDQEAVRRTVQRLFAAEGFPADHAPEDLKLCRDPLGKPYITWHGVLEQWAVERGRDQRHLHLSNSHDGGAHLILAACDPQLAGIGLDVVWLPRLRGEGKDADYLRRLAARFMSCEEYEMFSEAADADADEEALRRRVAAHFSLMEAASKALGTGLKIGGGLGTPASLPKQSLGVAALTPDATLLLDETARRCMAEREAVSYEAHWSACNEFLVSVVLLRKSPPSPQFWGNSAVSTDVSPGIGGRGANSPGIGGRGANSPGIGGRG